MPKLQKPSSLQKIAFECLVVHVVSCCDDLRAKGYLSKLREAVAFIKKHVRKQLSGILFSEFSRKFLHQFYKLGVSRLQDRPASYHRAALEIIMDIEIVGLRCEGSILRYMDLRDTHRLQRLEILDWTELQFGERKPRGLENFRLQNLTTLIYPRLCTDYDLEIVARSHCALKLQVLMIQESIKVTDKGLRALKSCPELRVANFHCCRISDDGINELLSTHRKLEEFNIARYYSKGEKSFNILSRSSSLICPSIKRFSIQSTPVTNDHLTSVVTLFPNVTHLQICCQLVGDLTNLKNLKKLKELNFSCGYRCFRMENLKQLLTNVGHNISVLNMLRCNPHVYVTQNDLNFIFQFCANIQSLGFDYEAIDGAVKLVVPPFRTLKKMECSTLTRYSDSRVVLEFGEMPALEHLKIDGFHMNLKTMESIVLDNVKFPNLKVLLVPYTSEADVNHIMQIARDKNLDFLFKNSFCEHVI